MDIPRRRYWIVALLSTVLAVWFAQPAAASTPEGESLSATNPPQFLDVTCNATSGTFEYHAEGTAAGPYSGSFVEDGTAVFDPVTLHVLSLDATFTIISPIGDVAGEKHLKSGVGEAANSVTCLDPFFGDTLTAGALCYQAHFEGGGNEVGDSNAFIQFLPPDVGQTGGSFTGDFLANSLVSCAGGSEPIVTICHRPPGNPGNPHTIEVSASALPAHIGHGDFVGPCFFP